MKLFIAIVLTLSATLAFAGNGKPLTVKCTHQSATKLFKSVTVEYSAHESLYLPAVGKKTKVTFETTKKYEKKVMVGGSYSAELQLDEADTYREALESEIYIGPNYDYDALSMNFFYDDNLVTPKEYDAKYMGLSYTSDGPGLFQLFICKTMQK